jgi:hypothetical protein
MRESKASAKVCLYTLLLQFAMACVAFLFFRETRSEIGAWLIVASWLTGIVTIISGIVATIATRRIRWLGVTIAGVVVSFLSAYFFAGFGL